MGCDYKLTYKPEKKKADKKVFSSEKELDSFLEKHFSEIIAGRKELEKYAKEQAKKDGKKYNGKSIEDLLKYVRLFDESGNDDAQARALELLGPNGELQKRFDALSKKIIRFPDYSQLDESGNVIETYKDTPDYLTLAAVTSYIESVAGNEAGKKSVPAFRDPELRKKKYEEFLNKKILEVSKGIAGAISNEELLKLKDEASKEADKFVEDAEIKGQYMSKIGDDVHKIMEVLALKKNGVDAKFPARLKVLTKYDVNKDEDGNIARLGEGGTVFEKTFDSICKKYNFSKDAKFFPEFDITSKYLNPNTKKELEAVLPKMTNVTGLSGKIDLLVIDHGKAYVFDWKTTSNYFGDWMEMDNEIRRNKGWVPSAKIISNCKQIALYAAMLESWGLEVTAAELVPFHAELKTDTNGNLIRPNVNRTSDSKSGKERWEAADSGENVVSIQHEAINNKQDSSRSSVYRIMQLSMPVMRTIVNDIKPITPQKLVDIDDDMKFVFGTTQGLFSEEARKFNPKFYRGYNEAGRKVYEDRIKPLSAKTAAAHPGMKYAFYYNSKVNLGYGAGVTVYFDENYLTSDGKTADQILEKYCEELEKVKSAQYKEFADGLIRQMQQGNNDETMFEDVIRQLCGWDQNKIKFIKEHFGKYVTGGWMLAKDPCYIDNGIFMFYNNDAVEIVSLTSSPLFAMKNYGTKWQPNNTILGNLGVSPDECDPYTTMASTHANMLMMRIMDVVSKNQNAFPGKRIRDIKVVNPFMKQAAWSDIDFINDNWTQICAASNGKLKLVDKSLLYKTTEAAAEQAKEICMDLSFWDNMSDSFKPENIGNRERLIDLLKLIKKRAASGSFDKNGLPILGSKEGYAYYCIQQMLLADYKIRMPFERDGGKIFESGAFPTGYYFNQPGRSHSVIVRTMDDLTNRFRTAYSTINNRRIDGFQKDIKAIYEDFGFNPNTSTRKKFFEQFFEQENGTVSRRMKIKNFADPFWNGHQKSVQAFIHILDSIAIWRGEVKPKGDEGGLSVWETCDPDRYYEMPLIDAGLWEYLKREGAAGGIKGITEAVKNKIRQKSNKVNSILFSEFSADDVRDKDPIQYGSLINNRYVHDNDVRDKLTAEGRGVVYSTDLELIIGTTNLAQALSETSASYGPVYAATMAAIGAHQSLGGLETPELTAYINDYVKRIYHGESLIDDSLKLVNGLLGFVKSFSSALALKFNTRAFSREMLVSLYNGLAESGFQRIPGVTAQDFAYGLWYTIREAPAEFKKNSLVGYLNRSFQLAGQSRSELGTANFITDLGAMTFDRDKIGYATSSLPDGYYRVGILIGKMHADGCFGAYEEVSDGEWRYNPKKDKRFAKYLEGEFNALKFKDYDASMGSKGEYSEAKALWNESVEAWRSAMNDPQITQPLQAYTPSEIGGIQEKADDLYGAFDAEHKSLMCSQFVGSMLMQFKTYISSQVNRWIKQGGHVNTWQRMHVKDHNGKKLYFYAATDEEIAAGKDALSLIAEDEITDSMDLDRITPYIKTVGAYTEGELNSTLAFCDAIVHLDGDGLKRLWADPVKRYGLIQGLMNTLGMLLFVGLVNLIFGEDMVEHKSEQPFYSQWAYGVLLGFAEDGPIWGCVGSLINDFNPPALLSMQRLCQTTKSVILGNKTLPEGVLQSMGATREFSGMFAE